MQFLHSFSHYPRLEGEGSDFQQQDVEAEVRVLRKTLKLKKEHQRALALT